MNGDTAAEAHMTDIFHVDTQFLRNALSVFEDLKSFEQRPNPWSKSRSVARTLNK